MLKDLGKVGLTRGFFNSEQDKIDHLVLSNGDPNGSVTGESGSLGLDVTNFQLYMNTDGATTWTLVSNAALLGLLTSEGIRFTAQTYVNNTGTYNSIVDQVNTGAQFSVATNQIPLFDYKYIRDGVHRHQIWVLEALGVGTYGTGGTVLAANNFTLTYSNDPNDETSTKPDSISLDDMGNYFETDSDPANIITDPSGKTQEDLNRIIERKLQILDSNTELIPDIVGAVASIPLDTMSVGTPVTTTPAGTCSFTVEAGGDIVEEILINSDRWNSDFFEPMMIFLADNESKNVMHCAITNTTDNRKVYVKITSIASVSTYYKMYLQVDPNSNAETFLLSNTDIVLGDNMSFVFHPGEQNVSQHTSAPSVVGKWVDGRDIIRTSISFTNATLVADSFLIHNLGVEFYIQEKFIIPGLGSNYPSYATPGDLLSMGYVGLYNPTMNQVQADFISSPTYDSGETWYYIVDYVPLESGTVVSTVSSHTFSENIDSTVVAGITLTAAMLTSNYENSESNSALSIYFVSEFVTGDMELNGSALATQVVTLADITSNLLIWYPQKKDLSVTPSNPFTDSLLFKVRDTAGEDSNTATLTATGYDLSQIPNTSLFVGGTTEVVTTTVTWEGLPETGNVDIEYGTDVTFAVFDIYTISVTPGAKGSVLFSTDATEAGAVVTDLPLDSTIFMRIKRSVGVYTNSVSFITAPAITNQITWTLVLDAGEYSISCDRTTPSGNWVQSDLYSLTRPNGNTISPVVSGQAVAVTPTNKVYTLKDQASGDTTWLDVPTPLTPYQAALERVYDETIPAYPDVDYADIISARSISLDSTTAKETISVAWTLTLKDFLTVRYEQGASLETAMKFEWLQNNFLDIYTYATLDIDMSELTTPGTIDTHTYQAVGINLALTGFEEWTQTHPAGEYTYIRKVTITGTSLPTLVILFDVGDNLSYVSGLTLG